MYLDGRKDSEAVRRKRNSSWLFSLADDGVRRTSPLLIKFFRPEGIADVGVGWKAEDTWFGPPSRESLIQRNFNDSLMADSGASGGGAGAGGVLTRNLGWILPLDSGRSLAIHGARYPDISACDIDRYLSESETTRCSATNGGGRGSLNPWMRRFLAAAAAGAKQLSETDRLLRSTLRYRLDNWLKSIGESGAWSTTWWFCWCWMNNPAFRRLSCMEKSIVWRNEIFSFF